MKIKVNGQPDQIIDFQYSGDTEDIKEDEIRENIEEIKRITLRKIKGIQNVEHLIPKFKIRHSNHTTNLLPSDLHARKKDKTEILKGVFEILNNPETILSLVYLPLPASQYLNGSNPWVGIADKDTHGRQVGGSIHKKSKKGKKQKRKKTRKKGSKKKRKRSKKSR